MGGPGAEAGGASGARRRSDLPVWLAGFALLLALVSLAYVARLQFGPLKHLPLDLDELHFTSCAARKAAAGALSTASCHDNKGPLISLLHQAIQDPAQPYDGLRIKLAAFGLLLVVAGQCAWLAWRMAGVPAALLAAALVIGALAPAPNLFGLKPDLLGLSFLLGALTLLTTSKAPGPWLQQYLCGVLLGLAALSKQTCAFIYPFLVLWTTARGPAGSAGRLRSALISSACIGSGLVTPMLLAGLIFAAQGQGEGYLASLFLYPSVYGQASPFAPVTAWAWRSVDLLMLLSNQPFLLLTFLAGLIVLLLPTKRGGLAWTEPLALLVTVALVHCAVLWIAPVLFPQHVVLPWIPMAIVGGVLAARFWQDSRAEGSRAAQVLVLALVLAASVSATVQTLKRNDAAGRPIPGDTLSRDDGQLRYAYVLGMWHHLYVTGRLVPASQVMFPWALPGVPAFWAYTPPAPGSVKRRLLDEVQQHNLRQLFDDFARTPPETIVLVHAYSRASDSARLSDVPGLDDYIARHCAYQSEIADDRGKPGSVYRCRR